MNRARGREDAATAFVIISAAGNFLPVVSRRLLRGPTTVRLSTSADCWRNTRYSPPSPEAAASSSLEQRQWVTMYFRFPFRFSEIFASAAQMGIGTINYAADSGFLRRKAAMTSDARNPVTTVPMNPIAA